MKFQGVHFISTILFAASAHAAFDGKYYFENCNNPSAGNSSIPFTGTFESNKFVPECAPDVLYSWKTSKYINWTKFETNFLNSEGNLFTWRTPLGTFGYGDTQIRVKLKTGIKFRWISKFNRDCSLYSQDEKDSTVFVATNMVHPGASEYILCSVAVAHSWSTNTLGAYLEAKNELDFLTSRDLSTQSYDAYDFKPNRKRLPDSYYLNPYFPDVNDPHTDWRVKSFTQRFLAMRAREFPKMGKTFYSSHSLQKSDEVVHFSSNTETYFKLNPEQLRAALIMECTPKTGEFFPKLI
jgi:hypothetical protein